MGRMWDARPASGPFSGQRPLITSPLAQLASGPDQLPQHSPASTLSPRGWGQAGCPRPCPICFWLWLLAQGLPLGLGALGAP